MLIVHNALHHKSKKYRNQSLCLHQFSMGRASASHVIDDMRNCIGVHLPEVAQFQSTQGAEKFGFNASCL